MENFQYDDFYMQILHDKKSIVGFLKTVFHFLARRTDFYYECKTEGEGIGFPPGVKDKIVQEVMSQCDPSRPRTKATILKSSDSHPSLAVSCNEQIESDFCDVGAEVKIETETDNQAIEPTKSRSHENPKKIFQETEYYNGACYGNYCWSQTISDLELHVLLPEHITKSKQLNIRIDPEEIMICDKLDADETIFGGKLSTKCRSKEAVWSISNRKLQITLDKLKETWWNKFLDNEPKLDLAQMDCSRPLEELSEESQAAIEKMRWDQQQKALGLPTSEDLKNQTLLRQAWDADGSPFKGQPFDPSIVKFN